METNFRSTTVGAIAATDYRKAEVFQKYRIDYCCGGDQSLAEAAKQAGVSEGELLSALDTAVLGGTPRQSNFNSWTPLRLVDHILKTHHQYVRETLPVLVEYGRKLAAHHGDRYPELIELDLTIRAEAQDLLAHMEKEELVLFPAIRHLADPSSSDPSTANLGFVKHAIDQLSIEHSHSGGNLEKIRRLTNGYQVPDGACRSQNYLYAKLKEFDADLQQHIHLENNILFPAALSLLHTTFHH
jgi:regulator of cell morphogenesis and NO signaling